MSVIDVGGCPRPHSSLIAQLHICHFVLTICLLKNGCPFPPRCIASHRVLAGVWSIMGLEGGRECSGVARGEGLVKRRGRGCKCRGCRARGDGVERRCDGQRCEALAPVSRGHKDEGAQGISGSARDDSGIDSGILWLGGSR